MNKRRGLGRGLDAFFPGSQSVQLQGPAGRESVAMIPVDQISGNPNQPRRNFEESQLLELAQSIAANGVLAPIVLRPKEGAETAFEIIAGERRWRAARLAGLHSIPALVRDAEDAEAIELALVENLQRADLNSIEEAAGYRQLMDDHGFTQDQLSRRLGKSRPAVANSLRLLSLPDSVQALVRDGRLSAGHGRALASLPPAHAIRLAEQAIRQQMSVRDLERAAARNPARGAGAKTPAAGLSADMADVENRLRFALATQVALRPGARGGSIEIRFANDEELQRIVDAICPDED